MCGSLNSFVGNVDTRAEKVCVVYGKLWLTVLVRHLQGQLLSSMENAPKLLQDVIVVCCGFQSIGGGCFPLSIHVDLSTHEVKR